MMDQIEGFEPSPERWQRPMLPLTPYLVKVVEREGFEPPTQRASTACSTGLSYLTMSGDNRTRTCDPLLAKQTLSQTELYPQGRVLFNVTYPG